MPQVGNNLLASLPDEWTEEGTSRKVKVMTRLIGSLPPIIGAFFVRDLSKSDLFLFPA